jgi:hypothetical protein
MTKPPSERGRGRQPLSPTGELMKPRKIRMTDAEWEDAKFIGPQVVRELIVKRAKKLRAIDKAKDPEKS